MSADNGHVPGIGGLVARLAAGVGARRRAARQAWEMSEPEERSWHNLAASSSMSGWLGPTATSPAPVNHQEEDGRAVEFPKPAERPRPAEPPRPARQRREAAPFGAVQTARRPRPAMVPVGVLELRRG